MVTEEDYERATKNPATIAVHFSVQPDAVSGIPEPSPEKESAVSPAVADYTADQIPPRGVEQQLNCSGNLPVSIRGGAEFGAVGPDNEELVRVLASLTPAQRELLLAIARSTAS
jgi:hypothetical protein